MPETITDTAELLPIIVQCAHCAEELPIGECEAPNSLYLNNDDPPPANALDRLLCGNCLDDTNCCAQPNCSATCVEDIGGEVDGDFACPGCVDDAVLCADCDSLTAHDAAGSNHDNYLCQSCVDDHYTSCADCSRLVANDSDDSGRDASGDVVCYRCAENYFYCDGCCDTFHTDDYGGDSLCSECYSPESEDDEITVSARKFFHDNRFVRTFGIERRFGVELEFAESHDARELCESTGWGACPDGTSGVAQEFKSAPMSGDKGLESIERFCRESSNHGNTVSAACGFHLHLDMRGEKELALARIATAYQTFLPLWQLFVPRSRRENTYCRQDAKYGTAESIAIGKSKPHKSARDRYCAVNWCAYDCHKTVEIRLHTGTGNADKIVNWTMAHLLFIDWARRTPFVDILEFQSKCLTEVWRYLANDIWGRAPALATFYRNRARMFGTNLEPIVPVPPPIPPSSRMVRLSPFDPRWIVPSSAELQRIREITQTRGEEFCGCSSDCTRAQADREIFSDFFPPQFGPEDASVFMLTVPAECIIAASEDDE